MVVGDAPRLPVDAGFSFEIQDFVTQCLQKDFTKRPNYTALLSHPFIASLEATNISQHGICPWPDVAEFVSQILDA